MRIGLVSTVATRVAAEGSGSVERIVFLLARELTRLGHDVTVFGAPTSEVAGELVVTVPAPYATGDAPVDWRTCEWINLAAALEQSHRFDVLHTHAYLWALPVERLSSAPMVHTLHVQPYDDDASAVRYHRGATITAISASQWRAYPDVEPRHVIHHGLDPVKVTIAPSGDDYVCFLGRFVPEKGPLHAVRAALAAGVRIVLAGPANGYFRSQVEPLVDSHRVEYVGTVTGRQRDLLLGGARALVYPLTHPEPFGLVPVEAMLCGTPVVATAVGAVPELVQHGVSGVLVDDIAALPAAIAEAAALDRHRVRRHAESRFSASRMARQYVAAYESACTVPQPRVVT